MDPIPRARPAPVHPGAGHFVLGRGTGISLMGTKATFRELSTNVWNRRLFPTQSLPIKFAIADIDLRG